MKKTLLSTLLLAGALAMQADVKLPAVIASDMVLQQLADAKLWGEAKPKSTVTITPSWSGQAVSVKADADGKWMASVPTPEAGGPYSITISDGSPITLDNVLIGEVWFCSGQSNMEMPMRGFDRQPITGTNDVIARAKASTPIRAFVTDSKDGRWIRQGSKTPQTDMIGQWLVNEPENVAVTSAAAYYFAKYINEVLDVPVGIIVSTLGGSKVEPWMSRQAMEQFPEYDLSFLDDGEPALEKDFYNKPCLLFNAKVNPLIPFTIKGFLWYQGESNRDNYKHYYDLMPAFVSDLRTRWGGGDDMPFYFVEIAPYVYEGVDGISGALLREAQSNNMRTIPNSGMASTFDIGNTNFIHPIDKATVGQRLAWWALGNTYGRKGFGYAAPMYKSMEVKDGKIYINVDYAPYGLCPMWTSLEGFEIAGDDKVFHPAFAEIETSTCRLAVSSPEVPNPVAVRYGFHNCAPASVFNTAGLPLVPFRTDDW